MTKDALEDAAVVQSAQTAEMECERAKSAARERQADVARGRGRRLGLGDDHVGADDVRRAQVGAVEQVGPELRLVRVTADDK